MWQPLGKADGGDSEISAASRLSGRSGRQPGRFAGSGREVEQRDAAIGAGDAEPAGREVDVGCSGLQEMAGERPSLLDHRCRASTSALPLAMIEREPPVPPPTSNSSLSPWTRSISSNGTPRRSTSTWAKADAWPWP